MFASAERVQTSTDLSARLADLDVAVRRVTDVIGDAKSQTGATRTEAIDRIERAVGVLATAKARLLVAERDAGTSLRSGDRTFAGTRARQTGSGYGAAVLELRRAETLVSMPAVAEAVAAGRVGLPHVDAIARAAASASPAAAAVLTSAEGQRALVDLATTHDAPSLGRRTAELVAASDADSLEAAHSAQRRRRFLAVRDEADGTHVRGLLDHRSGAVLRRALADTGVLAHAGRTPAQAEADALVALAQTGSGAGEAAGAARGQGVSGSDADTRPHVSLIVPIDALATLRRAVRGARGAATAASDSPAPGSEGEARTGVATAADGPAAPDAGDGARTGVATTENGCPVPFSELARVLCDCRVTRIAVDAAGEPVDLGRTRRTYAGPQRRAVIARDGGCAWNGCSAAPAECDVHHLRWWERDGGRTSVQNGVLLCVAHHREVHRRDLAIRRLAARDGVPPGRALYRFRDQRYGLVNAPPGFDDDTDRLAGAPRRARGTAPRRARDRPAV